MQQAFLVCRSARGDIRRIPVGASITVGRSIDCGCVIDDAAASRRHVRISYYKGVYRWKDLGSTNGTLYNGVELGEGELKHGDKLQIGEAVIEFEVKSGGDEEGLGSTTMIQESMVDWKDSGAHPTKEDRSEKLLRAVYSVMSEIASNYELCPLVDRILETTIKAVDAQRGVIVFAEEDVEGLLPCPECKKFHAIENGRLKHVRDKDFRISSTVAHRVLTQGESLLIQDTGGPGEVNPSESIVSLHLRSIICAPLRGKFGILGILYMDTDRANQQYTHEDMLLSTAVGNSAGLALENARMHSQILDKYRTDQEIEHAWAIQDGFLVHAWPEDDKRFSVYGEMRPAKTVGGDFYDFVRPDADHVGILIGDVSGKGVPAALTMAQLLAEFRLCAKEETSPTKVLRMLNEGLVDRSRFGTFCTLAYLVIDLRNGTVRCCNAGHHPALAIGRGSVRVFAGASGPPVGVLLEADWTDSEHQLSPGESVLLYTDGILEARANSTVDKDGALEEFGMEKLREVVHNQGASPKSLVERVHMAVLEYCEPDGPHDDCTMIALKYEG
ncbi:MAG: SpoIIE family protein phosphatase [Candidatus Hydrogenedentes bacterium]|nr:SpoIIE family protein phosphatase [Candidatus Hydrogenedentota bacterium]